MLQKSYLSSERANNFLSLQRKKEVKWRPKWSVSKPKSLSQEPIQSSMQCFTCYWDDTSNMKQWNSHEGRGLLTEWIQAVIQFYRGREEWLPKAEWIMPWKKFGRLKIGRTITRRILFKQIEGHNILLRNELLWFSRILTGPTVYSVGICSVCGIQASRS